MARRPFVAKIYDHYYGSSLYDARYPRPNPPTYRCALRLASTASRILDFGAGSGRYTLPLLGSTDAFLCAYDISVDACKTLKAHVSAVGVDSQRLLVTPDLDVARAAGPALVVSDLPQVGGQLGRHGVHPGLPRGRKASVGEDITPDLIDEGARRGQQRSRAAMTDENRGPAGCTAGYHLGLARAIRRPCRDGAR